MSRSLRLEVYEKLKKGNQGNHDEAGSVDNGHDRVATKHVIGVPKLLWKRVRFRVLESRPYFINFTIEAQQQWVKPSFASKSQIPYRDVDQTKNCNNGHLKAIA